MHAGLFAHLGSVPRSCPSGPSCPWAAAAFPGPRPWGVTILSAPLANHSFKKIEFQPAEAKKFFSTVRKEMALLATSLPDGIMVKTFEDRMASSLAWAWCGQVRVWALTFRSEWHLEPPNPVQGKKQAQSGEGKGRTWVFPFLPVLKLVLNV